MRSHKKHKHLQKALDADKSPSKSEDIIPYPTGKVPGRGDCQLIDFLGNNKANYNTFLVHSPLHSLQQTRCPHVLQTSVRDAAITAGIPKTSCWKNVPPVVLGEVLDVVR